MTTQATDEEIAREAARSIVNQHRAGIEWEVGIGQIGAVESNLQKIILSAIRKSKRVTPGDSGVTEGTLERKEAGDPSKQKWQPVESAPVNASVLVFIPNAEHYGPGIYRALRPHFGILRGWQVTGLHMGRDCGTHQQPTHWMPLPSVPGGNENHPVAPLSEPPSSPQRVTVEGKSLGETEA